MSHSEEKFFFNVNNFDDEVIDDALLEEEEEDLPPPPPLFTERELEAAKAAAFKEGRQQAAQEANESREQDIANMLGRIANDTQILFAAEHAREKVYEREVLSVCHAMFEATFPVMQEKFESDALIAQMKNILQSQQGQRSIEIRINGEYAKDIEALTDTLKERNSDIQLKIIADETQDKGQFQLSWDHGGAIYDSKMIVKEMLGNLEEMLAGGGATSHDERSGESNASIAEASAQDLQDTPLTENAADNHSIKGPIVEDNNE